MIAPEQAYPVVYLKAGELCFFRKSTLVITVLGSCLAVTMHSPRASAGCICHALLPSCERQGACIGCKERFRYVDCAIRAMVKHFERLGVERSELEVKCFGGANIFRRGAGAAALSVGRQNIVAAKKIIRSEGLTLAAEDVGGRAGRKIFFYTDTGEVLLKRLRAADGETLCP